MIAEKHKVFFSYRGDISMMKLLLDSVKVGPDAQHGSEQHAPLHVAAKAGMLNTLFAL
jgi:hypothetical protein